MSTGETPEIAAVYGALDSVALRDGGAASAHVRRVLAMSTNQLVCRPYPALTGRLWNAQNAGLGDETGGQLKGFCSGAWASPAPFWNAARRPGCSYYDCRIEMAVTEDQRIDVVIETGGDPSRTYRPSANGGVRVVGTGAWQTVTIESIPAGRDINDLVRLWLRGVYAYPRVLGTTGTYGSPNTGTIDGIGKDYLLDSDASWNTGLPNWASGGHSVILFGPDGIQLTPPLLITAVTWATGLWFQPEIQLTEESGFYLDCTYQIVQAPKYRIASVALYGRGRTI